MNFEVVMLFTQQVFHTLCFFLLLIPEIVIISTQISVVFLIKVLLIKKHLTLFCSPLNMKK